LRDSTRAGRSEWFYEHTYNTKPPRRPIAKSEGVRTARWKYIRYTEHTPPYEQLFDLQNDPGEHKNLVDLIQYAGVLTDMRDRCERLGKSAGRTETSNP
jgi:arylsulfatase A-like enzyme